MMDDPGLSWSQLRAFEACARLSSFSAAAMKLSISTSAVRFQISLLESRLGTRLFERQAGHLTLTKIGKTFANQIVGPMQGLRAACVVAQRSASETELTLTAPPLFAREYLLVESFLKWCDAAKARLDVSDNKRDLLSPGLIAAIRLAPEDHPDLVSTPIRGIELCIAAAPHIALGARPTEIDWWATQTLLTPSASLDGWKMAWNLLGVGDGGSPRVLPFSSYAAALDVACAGNGVILAPLPFAQREMATGRLLPISDIRICSAIGYSLIMRKELAISARGRALARKLVIECGK